jgi:hypothetical protein
VVVVPRVVVVTAAVRSGRVGSVLGAVVAHGWAFGGW